ncbi:hypothetical protein [Polyangium spumosum]|uniref:Uncharacterized protein n=1 Tax=Polyangium spumosum TaxID=889282 RepID=A0A6N7Q4P8_9BACT|nr:hypothetical protein [Polyangium spumosum]MRG98226.1 hypothetical protein [Polyangium spumosum]
MGVVSNFGAFIGHMMGAGGPETPKNRRAPIDEWWSAEDQLVAALDRKRTQDQIFRATSKARKIHARFVRLPPTDRLFLDAFFRERQYERSLEGLFGSGIGAIPFAKSAPLLPTRDVDQLHKYIASHHKVIERVRGEVHARYAATLRRYAEQEGSGESATAV